jgi:hypothetical protein
MDTRIITNKILEQMLERKGKSWEDMLSELVFDNYIQTLSY